MDFASLSTPANLWDGGALFVWEYGNKYGSGHIREWSYPGVYVCNFSYCSLHVFVAYVVFMVYFICGICDFVLFVVFVVNCLGG